MGPSGLGLAGSSPGRLPVTPPLGIPPLWYTTRYTPYLTSGTHLAKARFLSSRVSVAARSAHVHVSICSFWTHANMRRFNIPRSQDSGKRPPCSRGKRARPVCLTPTRSRLVHFWQEVSKNTVYRSLALKPLKTVSKSDAINVDIRNDKIDK